MTRPQSLIDATAPVILLGLLLFSGCTRQEEAKPQAEEPPPAPELRVLATVNGDPITYGEFRERFSRAGLKPEKEAEAAMREEFLNRLIERKMLIKEAQRRRIKVGVPEILARIEAMRDGQGKDMKETLARLGIDFEKFKSDIWEELMIEKLVKREVDGPVSVSRTEIRKYYEENQHEFERPEQVRVRQIVLAAEPEARAVLEELQAGADFAELAKARSTAPEAAEGGDLGYFAMGEMPGEFNVVFGLPKGGVSGVIKSPYGFHIFKLESKRKAGRISLDEASQGIAERLRQQKQDERYRRWIRDLRSRTQFVVNYQGLE
jgi:parvulin-like peptidyl-prolyl isomerase